MLSFIAIILLVLILSITYGLSTIATNQIEASKKRSQGQTEIVMLLRGTNVRLDAVESILRGIRSK